MIYMLIVVSILLLISYYFFFIACHRKSHLMGKIIARNTNTSRTKEDQQKAVSILKDYVAKDLYMTSFDNLNLHATYIKAKREKRLLICSHGYRGDFLLDFCYLIEFFLKNNTSLLLIDQRACSKSEGKYITFGAKEKHDLVNWVNYMENKTDKPIYLYGVSLGASTVLMSLGEDIPRINGVISDCGYSSMKNIFSDLCKDWFHLYPVPWIYLISIFTNLFGHFKIKDADAIRALEKNEIPILFIHGKDDDFVKPINTILNYNATKGEKEILWVENAGHAESAKINKEKYQEKLKEFFKKHD